MSEQVSAADESTVHSGRSADAKVAVDDDAGLDRAAPKASHRSYEQPGTPPQDQEPP